jgi:small nuclear ribonucleoprotein (snRNP)-like protein
MTLQAYDSHCNLVLGDVEETIYVVEEDENEQEITRVGHKCGYCGWTVANQRLSRL